VYNCLFIAEYQPFPLGFSVWRSVKKILWRLLLVLLSSIAASAQPADPLLTVLQQELNRSFANFKKLPTPVYFLSYQLTDNHAFNISASFGALVSSTDQKTRVLDVDVRVGDYFFDDTHPGGDYVPPNFAARLAQTPIPLENVPDVLQRAIWVATDSTYKVALQNYESVKTSNQVKAEREDKSDDFSKEPPHVYAEPEATLNFDRALWEKRARSFTARFAGHPEVLEGDIQISGELETRRFVNSEGSSIKISSPFYRILINASTRAEDGMELPLHLDYVAFSPEALPSEEKVNEDIDEAIKKLGALRKAPVAEPYTGPAILSGRASAVFFHEIFGHRIEGYRQKNEEDAQTFKKRLNQSVLPDFLSVYSDPSMSHLGKEDLVGYYKFDDQGIPGARVTVVENGILKNFLMSRSPIENFPHSNGHGRRQQGYAVAARQSNLIVESSQHVSRAELKSKLIEQIKAANKPYGLYFDDVEGGFTFTQRYTPNAFSVQPTVVYRIYPDGREELVRGLNLIGTPLIAFSKIVAADDEVGVFDGMCGAESGWVPVSAVAPGLLISQMEVQLKEKSQERPPILPAPSLKQ
jgi:predicted Zn-dependent protease